MMRLMYFLHISLIQFFFLSKVPAFFSIYPYFLDFLHGGQHTLFPQACLYSIHFCSSGLSETLFRAKPRIAQWMLCIIPKSSLGKSPKHLIWTQSQWQRSPSPFKSSFCLYVCVHKNMLAPHVYQDKCNVKPRLRRNYVMYSLHLFAQIYMLTTDCARGPLITDPPTAQSRAIRGKGPPNETMKIMNNR